MAQKRKSTAKKGATVKTKTTRKKSAAKRSKVTTTHTKSATHKKPEQAEWFLSWFEETPKKKATKSKSTKTKSKRKLSAKRK